MSMRVIRLDYDVPIRINSHSRTYLFSFRCSCSIHASSTYHNYTSASIARIAR